MRKRRVYLATGTRSDIETGPKPFAKPELGDVSYAIPDKEITNQLTALNISLSSYGDDPASWVISVHGLDQDHCNQVWQTLAERADDLFKNIWES